MIHPGALGSRKARGHHDCKTDPECHHVAYFEARVVTSNTAARRDESRKLCAVHLGEVVNDLADWARQRGITDGAVTVLIAGPPPVCPSLGIPAIGEGTPRFPFASIPL
jgi:hypothetical protein